MSLINFNHSNKQQLLFFGEDSAMQRYDNPKYPIFEQLYNTQTSYFWNPSEISLQKDRVDFQNLSEHERHIYTSNLKYQILLDSMQSKGVLSFLDVCSNSELEALIILWSYFELIHSKSYSHIIRTIYPNPSEVFDTTLSTPEIVERAKNVTMYYDHFVNALTQWNSTSLAELLKDGNETSKTTLYELKRLLYLAIVNVNILEGIRFYTSFACSFAFAENKKMIGNSDIISLIARDEACYVAGTEILTPAGWKKLDDVTTTDDIMQYCEDGTVNFVNPLAVTHQKYNSTLYKFKHPSGHFEQIVTYDHRMIYRNTKTTKIEESLAQDTTLYQGKDIISAGIKMSGRHQVTDIEMLNILFFYYGSIISSKSTDTEVACKFIIHNDFRLLFGTIRTNLNFYVSQKDMISDGIYTTYCILIPNSYIIPNFDWLDLNDISYKCARQIIELCQKFGTNNTNRCDKPKLKIYNLNVLNKLQQICTISGWAHKMYIRSDGGTSLEIDKVRDGYLGTHFSVKLIENYTGMVHCATVPSGMLVVRYNGRVSVGGNCHVQISENIIKTLNTSEDLDIQKITQQEEPTVVSMYQVAVEEEKAWANYLFKDGAILGLNTELLHKYIEFLANRRIKAIGKKPIFDISLTNPLPWMDNYLKSGNVTVAPQESEIISYVVGASNPDIDENTFAGFKF